MEDELMKAITKNPETLTAIVKVVIDKYKPFVYSVLQEIADVVEDYSKNKSFPLSVAKCNKNMYDAYIEVGFTEEQALALMINDRQRLVKSSGQVSSVNLDSLLKE